MTDGRLYPLSVTDPRTPKIELHVHLEGAIRPRELLAIATRNGVRLPADNEPDLAKLYEFKDFAHFISLWLATTCALRTEADFRQVVTGYAKEAAAHGAVYLEGIFTPAERVADGASWDEAFSGFCDGAAEAEATYGITVRLTPDIPRQLDLEVAMQTARFAVKYRDRGIVGLGLGGPEAEFPPEPFEPAFRLAKDGGIASVPHAGEVAGPASVRGCLDALGADRIRHGIRSTDDPGLVRELARRHIVCDVCPVSNLRTRAVETLDVHPLPRMLEGGILCSINTDDPAMFGTDLSYEYEIAEHLGCSAAQAFQAGIAGALCDEEARARLRELAASHPWDSPDGRR